MESMHDKSWRFITDGGGITAAAYADGIVRLFKLDDATSKSFKFLRIALPAGGHTAAIAFADEKSSIVVACPAFSGSSLYMYGEEKPKAATDGTQQTKFPLPEIKWEHRKIHDQRAVITLYSTKATYGTADGSTIIVSCSEGRYAIFLYYSDEFHSAQMVY
nr:transducin beta-like protein 2 [Ipomoea batatas]